MKNLVQQRHLRRVCGRLIVSPTSQSDGREENEKEEPEEDGNGRRKKSFQSEGSEENAAEEDGISNRHLSTTFIPPLTQLSVTVHWVGKNVAIQQIRGLWFECRFEGVPV